MTTPPVRITIACSKCGYHAGESTWRGPVYKPGVDISTSDQPNQRADWLEFTCEGCGYKEHVLCKDAR